MPTFAPAFERLHYKGDPLAQSVEHNTFNVGVLGSSPKRITFKNRQMIDFQSFADFLISQMHHFCTTQPLQQGFTNCPKYHEKAH